MELAPLTSFGEVPADGRILVYGTGEMGRTAVRILRFLGRRPAGYVDSFKDGALDDLPVMKFETYAARCRSDDVVLLCSSFAAEIAPKVRTLDGPKALDASRMLVGLVAGSRHLDRFLENGRLVLKRG